MLGKAFFFLLASLCFPKLVFATPPVITSFPQTIKVDEEFTTTASMSGLSKNATYRLRLAFAKPESQNYFGSTRNGESWYNGTPSPMDRSKFKTVTTDDKGSWQGEIKGKVETADPNYKDKDLKTFDFKIGRYTESGTSATWSEIVSVNIENPNLPTQAPTPTPKIKSTPIKTTSPTQKSQELASSPSPILPISQISQKEDTLLEDENNELENILATSTILKTNESTTSPAPIQNNSKRKYFAFALSGIFFLLAISTLIKRRIIVK